jgi:hypothetical protein
VTGTGADRPELEQALAAYRRLIEHASKLVAEAAGSEDDAAEPRLDPEPCP